MARFYYRGLSDGGIQQKGEIEATDERTALEALRERKITPLEIGPIKDPVDVGELLRRKPKRVPVGELVLFTRQFATLIDASVTVLNAIQILEEQTQTPRFREVLAQVGADIEGGMSLSQALAAQPDTFSELYVASVRAGEESGTLDEALRHLAGQLERDQTLRRQVKGATRYPIAVLVVAVLVVILMLLFVVPTFKEIFAGLGSELPAITQFLISMSELLVPPDQTLIPLPALLVAIAIVAAGLLALGVYRLGWVPMRAALLGALVLGVAAIMMVGAIQLDPPVLTSADALAIPGMPQLALFTLQTDLPGGLIPAPFPGVATLVRLLLLGALVWFIRRMWRGWVRTPEGRYAWDRFRFNAPARIGPMVQKIAVARFARTLSTLTRAGVPLIEALDIVKSTAGNKLVEEAVENARDRVAQGGTLAEPMAESNVFPLMLTRMIAVGEQSGALDQMLLKAAEAYEEEVDLAMRNLQAILEPLLIVIVATVVGFILIALYMPIVTLYDIFTQ